MHRDSKEPQARGGDQREDDTSEQACERRRA